MTNVGTAADTGPVERADLIRSKARVPDHVVFRSFAHETVVLNLDTGRYHGLDPVGGQLFELLPRADSVGAAAAQIAAAYGRDPEEVEADVVEFCSALRTRGLLELEFDGDA